MGEDVKINPIPCENHTDLRRFNQAFPRLFPPCNPAGPMSLSRVPFPVRYPGPRETATALPQSVALARAAWSGERLLGNHQSGGESCCVSCHPIHQYMHIIRRGLQLSRDSASLILAFLVLLPLTEEQLLQKLQLIFSQHHLLPKETFP